MTLKEILNKKPSERSPEEQKLALEYIWEQKDLEASQQQSGKEEKEEEEKIWKILGKAAYLRTSREQLAADEWTKQQDPFQM